MNSKHPESPAVVVIALIVVTILFGLVVVVGTAGYFSYRRSYRRALEAKAMAQRAEEEAIRQRAIAEEERMMYQRGLAESTIRVETDGDRLKTVQARLNWAHTQLDVARRTWKEIIERTNGQLTDEDVAEIDGEFTLLEERLKEMDEVFP
jgi:hypothetical protein